MIKNPQNRLDEDVSKLETVYGDGSSACDGASVDSGEGSPLHGSQTVISEKVRSLANNVYREFESLIDTYGRDVVQNLMPLVIQCLENLDRLYSEKSDLEIEMDLLREDNNQLINQFEKERQMRKVTEEKILQVEDRHEEYKNDMMTKMENLEMNIKMLEMKSKSAQDHVTRLEEKETEMKRENNRLHERYNDLLRNHMEAVERSKTLSSVIDPESASGGSSSRIHIHLHQHQPPRHQMELRMSEKSKDLGMTKQFEDPNESSDMEDELGESMEQVFTDSGLLEGESNGNWEQSREELDGIEQDGTMFEEMTMPDEGDVQSDDGPDCLDDQDYESEFGMSREIDNLIKENMELVETKNALNIVKDDLITQLDDLTGENEMLRDEVLCLTDVKTRLKARVRTLESEMKEMKWKLDKARERAEAMGDEDDETGDSDSKTNRRRFTRAEMVRLLSERNQYKERLMELEDAVRWTEMMRAKRDHPELVTDTGAGSTSGRRGMWKYFSGLFGAAGEEQSSAQSVSASPSTTGLNVFNANATSTSATSTPDPAKLTDTDKLQKKSGARGSLSAASNALAAFASFLAPSPSSAPVSNPLFMPPLPSNDLQAPARSSLTESQSNPTLSSSTMPKLVAHDIRLLPAPRGGPGSAVKRVEESNSQQR